MGKIKTRQFLLFAGNYENVPLGWNSLIASSNTEQELVNKISYITFLGVEKTCVNDKVYDWGQIVELETGQIKMCWGRRKFKPKLV